MDTWEKWTLFGKSGHPWNHTKMVHVCCGKSGYSWYGPVCLYIYVYIIAKKDVCGLLPQPSISQEGHSLCYLFDNDVDINEKSG